jgi:hypothetical protein
LYYRFLGSLIQPQHIHRTASYADAAAVAFFPVEVPYRHISLLKTLCLIIACLLDFFCTFFTFKTIFISHFSLYYMHRVTPNIVAGIFLN